MGRIAGVRAGLMRGISQFSSDIKELAAQLSRFENNVQEALDTVENGSLAVPSAGLAANPSYVARIGQVVKIMGACAVMLPVATVQNEGQIVVLARRSAVGAVTATAPGQLVNGLATDVLPLAVGAWIYMSTGDGWQRTPDMFASATGTWTPTIVGRSTPGTQTYSTQTGSYTKQGGLVTVRGEIVLTGNSGGSGDAVITMPFAASAGAMQALAFAYFGNITRTAGYDEFTLGLDPGSTRCLIFENRTANTRNNLPITSIGTAGRLAFSGTYETSA